MSLFVLFLLFFMIWVTFGLASMASRQQAHGGADAKEMDRLRTRISVLEDRLAEHDPLMLRGRDRLD